MGSEVRVLPGASNYDRIVNMVGVAQLVRALVCGTSCRGFESHHSPKFCESGGIGRRAGFRYQYLWCGSSSLPSRKKVIDK